MEAIRQVFPHSLAASDGGSEISCEKAYTLLCLSLEASQRSHRHHDSHESDIQLTAELILNFLLNLFDMWVISIIADCCIIHNLNFQVLDFSCFINLFIWPSTPLGLHER